MEIMEYLCRAEQRGRMMAATITPCIPFRMNVSSRDIHSCRTTWTDSCCPILPKCQAAQYGIRESVNRYSMAKKRCKPIQLMKQKNVY